MTEKLKPVHPGEVLLVEFLKPMELSQNRLALEFGVPPRRTVKVLIRKKTSYIKIRIHWIDTAFHK